jgi:hypothetical protein
MLVMCGMSGVERMSHPLRVSCMTCKPRTVLLIHEGEFLRASAGCVMPHVGWIGPHAGHTRRPPAKTISLCMAFASLPAHTLQNDYLSVICEQCMQL